jgi:hypothetical protein
MNSSEQPPDPRALGERRALSQSEREAILGRALQSHLNPTARIESQGSGQAVIVFGSKPNHLLHFLIGVFTCGAWWIVWLILALTQKESRRLISVDEFGEVTTRDF